MSGCEVQHELFIIRFLFFSLNFTFLFLLSFNCTEIHDVLFHPSLDLSLVALVVHSSLLLFTVTFFFVFSNPCFLCFNILSDYYL